MHIKCPKCKAVLADKSVFKDSDTVFSCERCAARLALNIGYYHYFLVIITVIASTILSCVLILIFPEKNDSMAFLAICIASIIGVVVSQAFVKVGVIQ